MKKVLVTGATGFTGGHLARHLAENGIEVVAFVRSTSNVDHLKTLGVDCRVVDIKDRDSVLRHFDEFDVIYHIAAAYRTEHSDRSEFVEVNVNATQNLLEAAAKPMLEGSCIVPRLVFKVKSRLPRRMKTIVSSPEITTRNRN
jgi:nucleoside-diphosphate-sugar epimerase